MRKIILLFAVFFAAVCCLTSCGGSKKNDEPETKAKYLTAAAFASSSWSGKNADGDVNLSVTSTTDMTLTYFTAAKTVSKNVEQPELKTVKITYTFDEEKGTFSGTGGDNAQYSGALTSTTALSLKMPNGEVSMTKK